MNLSLYINLKNPILFRFYGLFSLVVLSLVDLYKSLDPRGLVGPYYNIIIILVINSRSLIYYTLVKPVLFFITESYYSY